MSVRAVSWVLHESRSAGNDRLVLIVIADEADNDGLEAFPSIDRISRLARVPKRTVIRCLERLEAGGDLIIRRPEHPGRGRFNRYAVTMGRPPTTLAGSLGWPPPRLDPAVAAEWEATAEGCQNDTHGIRPQPGDNPGENHPETARNGAKTEAFGCHLAAPDPKTQIDTRAPRRRGLDPRPPDPTERTAAAARARADEGNRQHEANRGPVAGDLDVGELLFGLRDALGPSRRPKPADVHVRTPNEDDEPE